MTAAQAPPSPGTEARGEHHYLVFSPGSSPSAWETEAIEEAVNAFSYHLRDHLDLIIRISDPDQIQREPEVTMWHRIRVMPDRGTIRNPQPHVMRFTGRAVVLDDDNQMTGEERLCSVTLEVEDRKPGSRNGELTLSAAN